LLGVWAEVCVNGLALVALPVTVFALRNERVERIGTIAAVLWPPVVVALYYLLHPPYWLYAWQGRDHFNLVLSGQFNWAWGLPKAAEIGAHFWVLGVAALMLFGAEGIGQLIIGRRSVPFYLRAGLGLAVLGWFCFGIGLFGAIGWIPVLICLSLGLLVRIVLAFRSEVGRPWAGLRFDRWMLPVGGLTAVLLLGALAPETGVDALGHLNVARHFMRHGALVEAQSLYSTYYPPLIHLLYAAGWSLAGEQVPSLVTWVFLVLSLPLVAALAEDWGLPRPGQWLAALLYLGQATVGIYTTKCYLDVPWTFYSLAAVLCACRWAANHQLLWATLALCFAGCSAASRPHGLVVFGLVGGAMLLASLRQTGQLTRILALGTAMFVIWVCPWAIRNLIWTGNPLYPFSEARQLTEAVGSASGQAPWLLTLPLSLTFQELRYMLPLGPLSLALIPFGLARARLPKRAWVVVACVACYVLFWFYTVRNTRYLMPVLGLAAAFQAVGALAIWGRGGLHRWAVGLCIVTSLGITSALYLFGCYHFHYIGVMGKIKVLSGLESHQVYLERHLALEGVSRVMRRLDLEGPVLLEAGVLAYKYPRFPGPTVQPMPGLAGKSSGQVYQTFRGLGVRYVIVLDARALGIPPNRRWILLEPVVDRVSGHTIYRYPDQPPR